MNAPDRSERFVVPDGLKKVQYNKDTKVTNAGQFMIQREDHTLGNLVRCQVHKDPNVIFAGYRLPHPLEHRMEIKIQTNDKSTPLKTVDKALTDLHTELEAVSKAFQEALDKSVY
mmetsp:Transcript_9414/g.10893  ORF Transcript_9414/g.10893 Transcript_9414/m.10893 type:complete len:115 (-) Transcript_9414:705-1049(-)|eukprot:CAMPEP_0197850392 /NCGR_PEP_ID=MMETSP1438-20131217/15282_1 /TAXON_ID=1461541 /ORGANISM="Pterosperma sp., Strain CCMP1384" /LENGTH=114 /DNA_ID=CAMNT_0043463545 /DNA_START=218 /DNA_END=562 /DNA_ORIENTATION=+